MTFEAETLSIGGEPNFEKTIFLQEEGVNAVRAPLEPRASLILCATFALHAPHPPLSFLEWSETLKGGLYGCSVKKTDFANIVKFGHFWGGIAAKICICAKKCSTYGMLWVRTSKKNLCQPSDPWAF